MQGVRMQAVGWLGATMLAAAPLPALADPRADARAAYRSGDYATALSLWRPLAEAGDASAQFNLGVLYDRGEGVPTDLAEALTWYRRAAEAGDPKAQYNLGLIYEYGGPVAADPAVAAAWYRRAADQGDAAAQYNLAFLIDNGLGVAADPAEAAAWLRRAAEQGLADAQNDLGGRYWTGRGVPLDRAEAYKWASLAAVRAPPGPALEKARHNRDLIARRLSEAERAEGERRMRAWAPRIRAPAQP